MGSVHLWSYGRSGSWFSLCHMLRRPYSDLAWREYEVVEGADPLCQRCMTQHYGDLERLRKEVDAIRRLAYPMKASA